MARQQNSVRVTVRLPGRDQVDLVDATEQHDVSAWPAIRAVEGCLKNYGSGGAQLLADPPHDDKGQQE